MRLFDDHSRVVLQHEDRNCVGFCAGALILAMLATCGWYMLQGRPLTELDEAKPTLMPLRIDVNQASWPELALVPGVGEVFARRIVVHRQLHGPFASDHELLEVEGVGPVILKRMQPVYQSSRLLRGRDAEKRF